MPGDAATGAAASRRSRTSRSGAAYEQIKSWIVAGELTSAEVLNESELAARLGMSRTPVREALRKLSEDSLVDIVPGRGAWVRDVSLTDLREIFDLRKVLECLAAEQAVDRVPEEEIASVERAWLEIRVALQQGQTVGYEVISRLDNRFHSLIIEYCLNQRLKDFVHLLNQEILRYQLLTAETLADAEETVNQHLHLISLLKERDVAALSAGLRQHIARSEEIVFARR